MTIKLAITNYKGGTGKTSTAVNLAHGLAIKGKSVLLIDIDPQGSAAYCLGINPKKTLYNVLIDDASPESCIETVRPNLDLLASNEHLFAAELKLSNHRFRSQLFVRKLDKLNTYDYIIIDCPPSMNLLNQNALTFADKVIIPVSMEYLSLVGTRQLLKNIQIVNKMLKRDLTVCKVVPTFFDPRSQKCKHVLDSLERVFPGRLSTPIRMSISLSEAPGYRQTIFEFDPKSKGAEDYTKLTEEVMSDDGKEKNV